MVFGDVKLIKICRISPSNSLVFIEDARGGNTAMDFEEKGIVSNPTCISVGTLMEYDGETTISLGHVSEVERTDEPAFDGVLETPTGTVVVSMVPSTPILQDSSGSIRTRIRVWTNHPMSPDRIVIGFERI